MLALYALLTLQAATATDYRDDFDLLSSALQQNGAYVVEDKIDFPALSKKYRPLFSSVSDRNQLLKLWEAYMGELHDFHATLGSNNDASPRLVPSGADIFASWKNGHAIVDQVRAGSLAEKAEVGPEDEILAIGGLPVRQAAAQWLSGVNPNSRAWNWGLNSALAGRWNQIRTFTLRHNGVERKVRMHTALEQQYTSRVTVVIRADHVLYIRPENSLGQDGLISDFDHLVPQMRASHGIVLDLRNTPSGGTSTVARGIMGLFISSRLPYQRHRVDERGTDTVRDWVEYATPRLAQPVTQKLVVLVGRWTGSMGEGMAIGFDAMKRATVVGTRMAGLRGAVDSIELPKSHIRVFFPVEQVFHLDGTPRHEWVPPVGIDAGPGDRPGDRWWAPAMEVLQRKAKAGTSISRAVQGGQ